jgi:hypothetical protein
VRLAGATVPARALARIVGAALLMGALAALPALVLGGIAGLLGAVLLGAVAYPLALRVMHALTAEDLDRARALVERLPGPARTRSLALARFLCRGALAVP